MAKPGPKPQPTKLKKLRGNPGKRRLNKNEPKPETPDEIPQPPEYLDELAKEKWDELAKELYDLGLLTNLDILVLAKLCKAYSRYIEAEQQIEKTGLVIKAPSGYPVQNPFLTISNKAFEQMAKCETELGLTPSARSRISTKPKKKKKDPAADYLKKKKKLELCK